MTVRAQDDRLKFYAALLMGISSVLLSILNFSASMYLMMWSTIALAVGFFAAAILLRVFKMRRVASILMAILCGIIFTLYAIYGQDEGFSILWILLVPPVGMTLLGLRVGMGLSLYFQVLLFTIFYSPLRMNFTKFYSETFCVRFPLLYLICFAAAFLLSVQKIYYEIRNEELALKDTLTDLYNRRYYDEMKTRIDDENEFGDLPQLTVVSVDVNRLKYTNDTFGHRAGDNLLIGAADALRNAFPDAKAICRVGGDEFSVITDGTEEEVRANIAKIAESVKTFSVGKEYALSLAVGYSGRKGDCSKTIGEMEKEADVAMYRMKTAYYVENGIERRKK